MNDIFAKNDSSSNDISGKLTYTNVYESIPQNKVTVPIPNWQSQYTTEWRWRFFNFDDRFVTEISFVKNNVRTYFNKHGVWVQRNVDPGYDKYVTKVYYAYSNE